MQWFAAQLAAGMQNSAEFHLKHHQFNSFTPVADEEGTYRGRSTRKQVRIFPGYLFVEFDSQWDPWQRINSLPGIVRLLPKEREMPVPLPDGFVEELRGRIEGGEFSVRAAERLVLSYVKGDMVPIISGPFESFSGELVRYKKGSLVLLINLFGRSSEIIIPKHQVLAA